jgi:pimeloyl-ACP methyl ester carboxylesterase
MTPAPLILLPGLNNSVAVFDGVVTALEPMIEPIAMGLPALNRLEALADHVLADAPPHFALCGFSFGGYVALAILERAPERVTALALVGSLPGADTETGRAARERSIATAEAGGYAAMVRETAAAAFHPDSLADTAIMARRAVMIEDYGAERFIAHSRAAMARPDRSAILSDFAGPLLMMAGERDPLAPRDRMVGIAGEQGVHVIAGAGHLLPLEQPAVMAAVLNDWMRRSVLIAD